MTQLGRRQFLSAAGAMLASQVALTQPATRVYRIGFLGDIKPPWQGPSRESLGAGLRRRGWVEGRNFVYEFRWAEGKAERYPALAKELVRLEVDVIVAPSEDAALAAWAATRTIPIVTIYPLDPVRLGLIESYARPGGNVTGLSYEAGSQTAIAKQLELFRDAVPAMSRVAVLWNPASPQSKRWLEELQAPARTLRLDIIPVGARAPEDFEPAFARMSGQQADGLCILADPMFFSHRARLAELAVRHRLPTFSALHRFPEAGGLMSYVVDIPDLYARAAVYIDKILRGAAAAELPVEQPTKFTLTVNRKTAKALGLAIPASMLLRADRVIE